MPIRIQRRRVKGWKMPENTICVTRGTDYGNPFKVGHHYKIGNGKPFGFSWVEVMPDYKKEGDGYITVRDNAHAVEMYKEYRTKYPLRKEQLEKLRGKNLACFCKVGEACHADYLLEIANA